MNENSRSAYRDLVVWQKSMEFPNSVIDLTEVLETERKHYHLEEPISAGWIDVPLDSLADLVASKMTALVERGIPRDFLDILTICQADLLSLEECWALWRRRQKLADRDADGARATGN